MIIFARKHFTKSNASLFSFFIHMAIYLRAFTALLSRFFQFVFLPFLDFIFLFAGTFGMKNYWSSNFSIHYPDAFLYITIPVYCLIWIVAIFLNGGYDLPIKPSRIVRGIFSGTLLILIIYALLPEELRFSRALILLGAIWASAITIIIRVVLNLFSKKFSLTQEARKRLLIVGSDEESNRILSLLKLSETAHNFIGFVIYYTYPAAPPWYIQQHGNGFIAGTAGNTAGLVRFDDFFGVSIFKNLYAKGSNVFAAMPSLHSSYPLIVFYYGLKKRVGVVMNIVFATVMAGIWFAAVYTSHHYVLDVLAGIICAGIGIILFQSVLMKTSSFKKLVGKYQQLIS